MTRIALPLLLALLAGALPVSTGRAPVVAVPSGHAPVAASAPVAPATAAGGATGQELPRLLDTMSRVAALYADAALGFTCQEQITFAPYRSQDRLGARTTYQLDYFYIFNDDPDDGDPGLQDYRTYRADGEAVEPARVEPADLGIGAHLQRAYSWVFLFQPNLRGRIAFNLEAPGEALGRPARVIRFAPVDPPHEDTIGWTGRIWVDRESSQILRVEAVQSTDYRNAEPAAGGGPGRFLFTRAEVEFGFEKNGLRFPTEATVVGAAVLLEPPLDDSYRETAARLLDRGMPYGKAFRVQQRYREYRFFSVRAVDEIRALTRGIQPR